MSGRATKACLRSKAETLFHATLNCYEMSNQKFKCQLSQTNAITGIDVREINIPSKDSRSVPPRQEGTQVAEACDRSP